MEGGELGNPGVAAPWVAETEHSQEWGLVTVLHKQGLV